MILSELRAQGWKLGAMALAVLAVAAVIACLYFRASAAVSSARADAEAGRAQALEGQLENARQVIQTERRRAKVMTAVAEQYEKDKADALAAADRVAADLRAGNLRLRDEWASCETGRVSGARRSAAELDAAAQVRERLAGEIVSLGRQADAQVRGLQSVIRAEREAK